MKNKKALLFFALLGLFAGKPEFAHAQDGDLENALTLRVDFMVPQIATNKAFKLSFSGIFEVGGSVNYRVGKFNFGPLYRYIQFQVRADKIPNIQTILNVHSAGLKLNADIPYGKSFLLMPGLNTEWNFLNYTHLPCSLKTASEKKSSAFNLEPNMSVVFLFDEGFGIGLQANYNILTYNFNPDNICLDEYKSYSNKEKTGLTGLFGFGFVVYWDLRKRGEAFDD